MIVRQGQLADLGVQLLHVDGKAAGEDEPLPPSKASAAPPSSCAFHVVPWFGWASNCSAICTIVRSPLIAAIATFDLKAGEWLRLGHLHHWMHLSRRHYRAHYQATDPLTLPSEIVELFLIGGRLMRQLFARSDL